MLPKRGLMVNADKSRLFDDMDAALRYYDELEKEREDLPFYRLEVKNEVRKHKRYP